MPALPLPRRLGALALLAVSAAGCGALTPSLFAPSALAPNVVPGGEGSSAVVTAREPGRGLHGRVVDRTTGAALPDVTVSAQSADGGEAEARTDASGAFYLAGLSGTSTLRAETACHAALDARPGVGADSSASVLVLLMPAGCAQP